MATGSSPNGPDLPSPGDNAMGTASNVGQSESPSTHILELTYEALRIARMAAGAAAEGIATSSAPTLRTLRDREKELDSLDRDVDDLVTATITGVAETQTRELLACMKFVIALERIGDLLSALVIAQSRSPPVSRSSTQRN